MDDAPLHIDMNLEGPFLRVSTKLSTIADLNPKFRGSLLVVPQRFLFGFQG